MNNIDYSDGGDGYGGDGYGDSHKGFDFKGMKLLDFYI